MTEPEDEFIKLSKQHKVTAIAVLEGMGHPKAAKLLAEADMTYSYRDHDQWDGGRDTYDVHLSVDPHKLSEYDEWMTEPTKEAFERVAAGIRHVWIGYIIAVPSPPQERRTVTNQALDWSNSTSRLPQRHNMRFRSEAEVAMFDALVKKQSELPKTDTILIVPLPSVFDGQKRSEPDFLITYKGRVGAIEVDDPTHRGRWAADRSRDQRFEECGVAIVRRITLEDALNERERNAFIDSFLDRLVR